MRISEATALRRQDVDLKHGILHIRQTKFGKSRVVPLHPSATRALQRYVRQRDREPSSTATDFSSFLIMANRRGPASSNTPSDVCAVSLAGAPAADIASPVFMTYGTHSPCRRLQRWYEEGADIERNILALSTYLGHAKVTDTYWYLTATPELMAIAARRLEALAPSGGEL